MLPPTVSLTSDTEGALTVLQPTALVPSNPSGRSRALHLLEDVAKISISHSVMRGRHRYYVIGIYLKHELSQITVNHEAHVSPKGVVEESEPDIQVERRYSEFTALRDDIHQQALLGHKVHLCSFCLRHVKYSHESHAQPRLLSKLANKTGDICKLLDQFLNDTVNLALQAGGPSRQACHGSQRIPIEVTRFMSLDSVSVGSVESLQDQTRLALQSGHAELAAILRL